MYLNIQNEEKQYSSVSFFLSLFTTMEIAQGSSSNWSYPSWPSQIDQILISDELFDNEIETKVLKLEVCNDDFPDDISDHRPVLIRIQGN